MASNHYKFIFNLLFLKAYDLFKSYNISLFLKIVLYLKSFFKFKHHYIFIDFILAK